MRMLSKRQGGLGGSPWETLVIKHSRPDRGWVISSKEGDRAGSVICNPTPGGIDIYIVNAQREVSVLIEASQDGAGSVAFLVPVGPIVGRTGRFRFLGRLARSTGRLDNKFVFQPAVEQEVLVAIGSALSRSFVIRRGGKEVASFEKGSKSLEIKINAPLVPLDKAVVIGIAVATSFTAELKGSLRDDMKLPAIVLA